MAVQVSPRGPNKKQETREAQLNDRRVTYLMVATMLQGYAGDLGEDSLSNEHVIQRATKTALKIIKAVDATRKEAQLARCNQAKRELTSPPVVK